MIHNPAHYDVIVIGGGPAGMMAAGRAAQRGRSVVLLEKNPSLGKKLLITGGGRCNVTNNTTDNRVLLQRYGDAAKHLHAAFAQQNVEDTLRFFHERGMPTIEEPEGRLFPASESAQSVWDVLVAYMREGGVQVRTDAAVERITRDEQGVFHVQLRDGEVVRGSSCVVATGGVSRPETGSTGEGFGWLAELGHTIAQPGMALVPLATSDRWSHALAGRSLSDIALAVYQDGRKQFRRKGKLLFTHEGVSGPTILNMSKEIGDMLPYGTTIVAIDLVPHVDHGQLKEALHQLLTTESNKQIKNALGELVPSWMVEPLLQLAQIARDTPAHSVRSEQRKQLVSLIKAVPLRVTGLLGEEKAIVSSGGVELREVNFQTMESRLVPGLYVIGDVLNINRPSGGYSLQLCWTTGYVAGDHA